MSVFENTAQVSLIIYVKWLYTPVLNVSGLYSILYNNYTVHIVHTVQVCGHIYSFGSQTFTTNVYFSTSLSLIIQFSHVCIFLHVILHLYIYIYNLWIV